MCEAEMDQTNSLKKQKEFSEKSRLRSKIEIKKEILLKMLMLFMKVEN